MNICTNCGSAVAGEPSIPPSPVPNLINTNAIPSRFEEGIIRATMHKMDSDLSQLDDKINQLQEALDDLRRIRQVLSEAHHQYSHQHMPLVSPIRHLPPEMLSEIFLRSIPSRDPYFLLTLYDLRRAVMLPGSVCKRWRDIALSTPRLWSSIGLQLHEKTVEADVDLTRTWLTRSGGMPLTLQIGGVRRGVNFHSPPATHPVVEVLTQHAER